MTRHYTKSENRHPYMTAKFWAIQAPELIKIYGRGITESYRERWLAIKEQADFEIRTESDQIGITSKFI